MQMSNSSPASTSTPAAFWRQRFTKYSREAAAYWRDVGRSGFVLVLVAAIIGGAYEYGRLLHGLPAGFPYVWIALVLLVPTLALGSMRTLVRDADRVFLLPLEGRLGGYFRRAFGYSYAVQAGKTAAALLLLWPLYAHCTGSDLLHRSVLGWTWRAVETKPFSGMLATALVLKALHLFADWQESRIVDPRRRILSAALRIMATAVLVPIWFELEFWQAWAAAAGLIIVWLFTIYNSRKYFIGWDRLLYREAVQQRRLYRWFRFFTDVPQLPAPVRRRRGLALMSRRLSVRRENAYPYLYEKTFLRTELCGIYIRFTLIGAVLVYFLSSPWLKAAFLLLLPLIGLMQLSGLADAHRHTFWLELYPLPHSSQASAVLGLAAPLAVAQTAVLCAAYAFSAPHGAAAVMPFASLAAVLLALRWRLRPQLRRRFGAEPPRANGSGRR